MARRKRNVRSEIERAHNRANLKSHIRALGLQSEEEYRAWCRKRGLGDGLHKSNRQIHKERQLARRQQGEAALTRTTTSSTAWPPWPAIQKTGCAPWPSGCRRATTPASSFTTSPATC